MTNLRRWFLKKIVKDVVIQGNHRERIINFNSILVEAARKEFTEDNKATLDCLLQGCLKEALVKN